MNELIGALKTMTNLRRVSFRHRTTAWGWTSVSTKPRYLNRQYARFCKRFESVTQLRKVAILADYPTYYEGERTRSWRVRRRERK